MYPVLGTILIANQITLVGLTIRIIFDDNGRNEEVMKGRAQFSNILSILNLVRPTLYLGFKCSTCVRFEI